MPREQEKIWIRLDPKDKGNKKKIRSIRTNTIIELKGYVEEIGEEPINFNPLTSPREARYAVARGTMANRHEIIIGLVKPQDISKAPSLADDPKIVIVQLVEIEKSCTT